MYVQYAYIHLRTFYIPAQMVFIIINQLVGFFKKYKIIINTMKI